MDDLTEEIVELTVELMEHRTTRANERARHECVDRIEEYFHDVDVETRRHEVDGTPSVVVTYDGETDPEYMLHGHVDVISVDDEGTWEPRLENRRLYGRGAADMKGGVAVLMRLVRDLAGEDPPSLGLMVTSDEEIGGFDGARHLMNEGRYDPSFALSAEPDTRDEDGWKIVPEQKGVFWVEAAAYGENAHGSRPWEGSNALKTVWEWYDAFEKLLPDSNAADPWHTTANLGMLRGGDNFNTVPGIAAMKLDIRYTEGLQPAELLERMRNVNELSVETAETVARDADIELSEVTDSADDIVDCTGLDYAEAFAKEMNAEVDISDLPDVLIWIDDDTPAMHTDSSNEYVQRLRQTVESTTDGEAVVERELGASDMAFFSGNGVPCVVFGPCGDNLHEPGEYLEVDSLKPVYRTLRAFVTDERETTSDE